MTEMRTEEQQKREIINRRSFSFRLNVFFFATFLAFSVLIVRLAVLQFVEGPGLKEIETSIGTRNVKIPPIRGNIYDVNGYPIAYSTSTQSLYFTLEPGTGEKEARAMAEKLAATVNRFADEPERQMTSDEIFQLMDVTGRLSYVYEPRRIKADLTEKEIAYFMEHRDLYPGIDIVEESIRNYDKNTIAVQLVGYMKGFNSLYQDQNGLKFYQEIKKENGTRDPAEQYLDKEKVGYDGIELMYQEQLRGKNGVKSYPVDNMSRIVGPMQLTVPEKGNNLFLTIHKDVQLKTEEAIMNHLEKLRTSTDKLERAPYAKTGYAVAMEVKTGKVIAMASMPDYDPNVWQGRITQEQSDYLQYFINNGTIREVRPYYEDEKEGWNHPSSLVFLGSTQKPLTVLLGLNEKLITTNTTYNDRGYFSFGREGYQVSVRNASNARNGLITPVTAISKSSNAFMSEMIGNKLYMLPGTEGMEIWDRYMKEFGLGVSSESGLPNESKGVIGYFDEAKSGSRQSALIYASFGQQGRYTVLQLAQYMVALANKGKRMKPQFINEIKDAYGNVIERFEPVVLNEIDIREEYWETVHKGMASSVQGFDGFPYPYLRKTGTSQQDVGKRLKVENAVFISAAPADDPVLAVAVVVPDGGYGGRGAAPIARQIFDAYDEYIGLRGTPRKLEQPEQQGMSAAGGQQETAEAETGG
ncbi:peptidoglycan D,D-transpeptidase FtsI family protein [Paenibacillus tarimensis]